MVFITLTYTFPSYNNLVATKVSDRRVDVCIIGLSNARYQILFKLEAANSPRMKHASTYRLWLEQLNSIVLLLLLVSKQKKKARQRNQFLKKRSVFTSLNTVLL